jgi:uncharacterized membrane protein
MSRYFLAGGIFGFCLSFAISLTSGADIHSVLWHAMVGCIVGALLFRYYIGRVAMLYMQVRLRKIEEQLREERQKERQRENERAQS